MNASPPARAPMSWATTYPISSRPGTIRRTQNASVIAGLRCAPERRPSGETTSSATQVPTSRPVTRRRAEPDQPASGEPLPSTKAVADSAPSTSRAVPTPSAAQINQSTLRATGPGSFRTLTAMATGEPRASRLPGASKTASPSMLTDGATPVGVARVSVEPLVGHAGGDRVDGVVEEVDRDLLRGPEHHRRSDLQSRECHLRAAPDRSTMGCGRGSGRHPGGGEQASRDAPARAVAPVRQVVEACRRDIILEGGNPQRLGRGAGRCGARLAAPQPRLDGA